MKLATQLVATRQQTDLTISERAALCCDLAKRLEKAGEYEAAIEAFSEFWPDRFGFPRLDGLDEHTRAEVLLRVGALAGWVGSARSAVSQEKAKDLLTQSAEIFTAFHAVERVAEAHSDLALCYWREGAFDEAKIN